MPEILQIRTQEQAEKFAEKVSKELKKIANSPTLSAEASMYGTKFPELSK